MVPPPQLSNIQRSIRLRSPQTSNQRTWRPLEVRAFCTDTNQTIGQNGNVVLGHSDDVVVVLVVVGIGNGFIFVASDNRNTCIIIDCVHVALFDILFELHDARWGVYILAVVVSVLWMWLRLWSALSSGTTFVVDVVVVCNWKFV